jgi:hypothetical protein
VNGGLPEESLAAVDSYFSSVMPRFKAMGRTILRQSMRRVPRAVPTHEGARRPESVAASSEAS